MGSASGLYGTTVPIGNAAAVAAIAAVLFCPPIQRTRGRNLVSLALIDDIYCD